MTLPTVFDLCTPRDDVLDGTITDSDFAANLARVLRGDATPDYLDPKRFFANTYPTEGLKSLLEHVCARLSGKRSAISAVCSSPNCSATSSAVTIESSSTMRCPDPSPP